MADALSMELPLVGVYGGSAATFDATDLKNATPNAVAVGWVACAKDHNATITHVGFRQGTTTGTPASGSYKIGIYTVDGSGLPTATDLGGGSPTAATFQPTSGNDGKFVWVALTNSVQIARATYFAVVLENNADTSTNGITVTYRASGGAILQNLNEINPYHLTYASSTWTKGSSAFRQSIFGYKSASKAYGFPLETQTARTTSTSGNRLACKFNLPSGWGTSYTLVGARMVIRKPATALLGFGLWNAAGTLLAGGTAYDGDIARATATQGNSEIFFTDTTLPTLSFGTDYYLGVESVSSSTVGLTTFDCTAAGDLLAYPLGANKCYSTWNGSAWSDTTTSVPIVCLILDDITPPSAGGGLIRHPGMLGNLNG